MLYLAVFLIGIIYYVVKYAIQESRKQVMITRKGEALAPLVPLVAGKVSPTRSYLTSTLLGNWKGVTASAMNKTEGGWSEWAVGLQFPPGGKEWRLDHVDSRYTIPDTVPALHNLPTLPTAFRGSLPYIKRDTTGLIIYTVTVETDTTVPTVDEFQAQLDLLLEIGRLQQQRDAASQQSIAAAG